MELHGGVEFGCVHELDFTIFDPAGHPVDIGFLTIEGNEAGFGIQELGCGGEIIAFTVEGDCEISQGDDDAEAILGNGIDGGVGHELGEGGIDGGFGDGVVEDTAAVDLAAQEEHADGRIAGVDDVSVELAVDEVDVCAAVAGDDHVFIEDEVFNVLILAEELKGVFGRDAAAVLGEGRNAEKHEDGDEDGDDFFHGNTSLSCVVRELRK